MTEVDTTTQWERTSGESAKAYEAFVTYCNAGSRRTLRACAASCGVGLRTVEGWSARYGWAARCEAYAEYQEAESRRQQIEQLAAMNAKHIAIAKTLQAKAIDKLNSLNGATSLSPREALAFLELSVKVERLAIGAPTDVSERRVEATTTPGRMSRAILESPDAMAKALDLLDLVATMPSSAAS